jgi:hypothetical protein
MRPASHTIVFVALEKRKTMGEKETVNASAFPHIARFKKLVEKFTDGAERLSAFDIEGGYEFLFLQNERSLAGIRARHKDYYETLDFFKDIMQENKITTLEGLEDYHDVLVEHSRKAVERFINKFQRRKLKEMYEAIHKEPDVGRAMALVYWYNAQYMTKDQFIDWLTQK